MARKLAKSAQSQKRLLDAAAKIFRDYGYAGTTMRAIAEEADLQAGSIYYHYKSKDELIGEVLDIGINAVIDSVRNATAALPPEATGVERIETAIRAHLSAILEFGDYTLATRRVFGQVPDEIRAKNLKLRDTYAAMWRDILLDAQKRGELRPDVNLTLTRLFVLGALNWVVEWYKPGGRSIEEVAREFAALVVRGMAAGLPVPAEAEPEPVVARPRLRAARRAS
ncbi:TetR family transcriptional regulator [Alsobacter sp. R-9]